MTAVREALAGARHSAMHLEMRDAYTPDDPEFRTWQRGERIDAEQNWRDWLDVVRATVARGVVMRRARIVSEPISDYIRYEYELTPANLGAGERVRWLPRHRATDLLVPPVDFWVVDESTVVFNHFAGDGRWADPGMETIRDTELAKQIAAAFEAVWERATPHKDYHP